MTIRVNFNQVFLDVEYKGDFLIAAYTVHGDDVYPLIWGSTGLVGELTRLVKEAHRKEYGVEG